MGESWERERQAGIWLNKPFLPETCLPPRFLTVRLSSISRKTFINVNLVTTHSFRQNRYKGEQPSREPRVAAAQRGNEETAGSEPGVARAAGHCGSQGLRPETPVTSCNLRPLFL